METNCRGAAGRVVLVLMLAVGVWPMRAQEMAPPPMPMEAHKQNPQGLILVEVKFDAEGKVDACHIEHSNAPLSLEASTITYVKREWNSEEMAGRTVDFRITFDELPWYATHWDEALVPPPNLLPAGDPGRRVKLRVTFGADGWVEQVQVMLPSGLDRLDRQTGAWVKVHWHNIAYAGQTFDTPIEFKTPVAARPEPAPAR